MRKLDRKDYLAFAIIATLAAALWWLVTHNAPDIDSTERWHYALQITLIALSVLPAYWICRQPESPGLGLLCLTSGFIALPVIVLVGAHFTVGPAAAKRSALVRLDNESAQLLDYRLGDKLTVPECAIVDVGSGLRAYSSAANGECFRHIGEGRIGMPAGNDEQILIDRFDLGRHYAAISGVRPICVALHGGRIAAVAVHAEMDHTASIDNMRASVTASLSTPPVRMALPVEPRRDGVKIERELWKTDQAAVALLTKMRPMRHSEGYQAFDALLLLQRAQVESPFVSMLTSVDDDCPRIGTDASL